MSSAISPLHEARHAAVIVGRLGEQQFVEGWHERELDGRYSIPYRASSGSALIVLRGVEGARRLNLLLSAPVGLHGEPFKAHLTFNQEKVAVPLSLDQWVFRSFPLEITQELLQIRVEAPAVIPDQVLGNGDARPLGIFLSAIWQE